MYRNLVIKQNSREGAAQKNGGFFALLRATLQMLNTRLVFKLSFSLLTLVFLTVPNLVSAQFTYNDGLYFYGVQSDTMPYTKSYTDSLNSFSATTTTVTGSSSVVSIMKSSPTKEEMIAATINSTGNLQVMCFDGSTWTNEWTASLGGTGTTRRADINYETATGDVVVLYSNNASSTNELAFRTKSGSSGCGTGNWSSATNLDPVRTSQIVQWVKIASDPRATSSLMTAIWADANSDLSAMVWDGSAWGNEHSAALETALEVISTAQDTESFDVAYESLSGDVMVAWGSGGTNGTNGAYYAVCTGGTSSCTWGSVRTAMPTFTDDASHISIAANPISDQIVFASVGNAGADLLRGIWSGTAWTNTANADTSAAAPTAGRMFVATGWLHNNGLSRAVLTYYDNASTNINWMTASGTTWTNQSDSFPATSFGTQTQYKIVMNPTDKSKLTFIVSNSIRQGFVKRLAMDSTGTFTWTEPDAGVLVGGLGSNIYRSLDFAYWRAIPSSVISGVLYTDAGSTTATSGLTIKMVVGTSTPSIHSTTTTTGGAWTFPAAFPNATSGTPVSIWLDGDANDTTTIVSGFVTSFPGLVNVPLYYNYLISYGASTSSEVNFSNFAFYDSSDDADILYTVTGTTSTSTANFINKRGKFIATESLNLSANYQNDDTITMAGGNWTARSASEANYWFSVTYGNGLFVAVSGDGTNRAMTSPDGITWTARSAAEANTWRSVTYGNGLFVAVAIGGTNRVMTSPDGITWTARSAAQANSWWSVTYGNGLYVAVSYDGTNQVMTSPDGSTWTARSASESNLWRSITYGNGLYVAVSSSGTNRVMTTADTSLWLTGASDQTLAGNLTGASALRDVKFSETGAKTFANNASTTNLTIATSSATVTAPTILSVAGNFTNRSYFAANSGTVILSGLNQTLSGTTTFNNLAKVATNHATTTFEAGALYTITGNLTFSGVNASTTHALRSSASGTQWKLDPQGTRTLSYLDVKDSNNINVTTVSCGTGCIDGTGNTNWSFVEGGEVATISSVENLHFYTGEATTTIGTITITEPATPTITAANDIRLTIATTTTNFRFNTNTTSLTFGGSASGKVNSTVSYADGGATLVIDVTTNFAASDTLTIGGIAVGSFASVSTTTSTFSLHTDGNSIGTPAATDDKTIRITGSLLATNHASGQVSNEFSLQNKDDETFFAFNLEAVGENTTVTDLVITLAGIQQVDSSNISDFKLYRDTNSNRTLDGGDILLDGSGILTINGQNGAVTFSSDFLASTSANYIMTGDTSTISNRASVVFKLASIGVTALGATSNYSPYIINSVSSIQHNRHNSGGGGSSARVGDDAPPGDGIVSGGGGGGGGGGAGQGADGQNISADANYFRPTTTGSPDNEWTNGGNALVSDGVYATAASTALKQSYTGFSFGIPGSNTIQGIAVKLDASGTTADGTIDVSISWDNGNSYTTAKATPTLSGSDVVYTVGGVADTWGRSWSAGEFSSGNFILRVAAQPASNTVRLDALEVRVYHQAGGGGSGGGGGI